MAAALENHLIIGLGGTGGSILRSFRKLVYQNFRTTEATNVNLRYLYVDTRNDVMGDEASWKILGTSVQLPQSSQLEISGMNLNSMLDNINDYPGIAPWIGSREQLRAVVNSVEGAQIFGAQKRRLGRFLFACRVAEFRQRVLDLVKELETGSKAEVTFHLCCGLAGGTGSGSLIDAVCQIRSLFPQAQYRIIIYALLPERFPAKNRLRANYHANGYAALQELNALEVRTYRPWDLSGIVKGRLENLQDPYNCCYLFTDENEDHRKFAVETELPDILAAFLFQKIVAARDVEWAQGGDSIKRQERLETGNQANEKEVAPQSGKPERSRRFFTFGTKKIVYPEEEIREYLTYLFAQQASLQLQFNNWSDPIGYQNEPPNRAVSESLRAPETAQRWQLTDDHLMLSVGILPDEKANRRWKPISAYWMGVLPNFKSTVTESNANRAVWLDELAKMCAEAYDSNYRDLGVQRFYDLKRNEIADHANEIRRGIESALYHDWDDGAKSMSDIARTLAALLKMLEEKTVHFDEVALRWTEQAKAAEGRVTANLNQWARIGIVSTWLGARRKTFDDQAQALQDLYTYRTYAVAAGFAKGLVQAVSAAITSLAGEVNVAVTTITSATTDFMKQTQSRLPDAGEDDVTQQVIRFYKPAIVKTFGKSMVLNEEQQKLQTAAVRAALTQTLGDNASFSVFNQRVSQAMFFDILSKTCERSATQAHDAMVAARKVPEGVLKISVVDWLFRQFGTNRETLRAYITDVVSQAKNFLVFDPTEVTRVIPGNEALGPMFSSSTIILPKSPDRVEFDGMLEEEFKQAGPGEKEVANNPTRPNEITLINVTSAFPARFVAEVAFLKERYDVRVSGAAGAQATFELHSEGDGSQFPSLYLRKIGPEQVLPYLLLASALDIVQQLKDPETGAAGVYLRTKDKSGRDIEPVRLGDSLTGAVERVSAMSFDAMETQIQGLLAQEYLHSDKRAQLMAQVQKAVDTVKADRPNPLDKTQQAYTRAGRAVEDLLKKTSET